MGMELDLKQEIKDRIALHELIGTYVSLKRAGARWKGLCPFHAEKTPSFSVDSDHGFWKCFGCQAAGDVFSFLQRIENLTFPEALERLARQLGLPYQRPGEAKERASERQQLLDLHALAARFYAAELEKSSEARNYLERRGLSASTIAEFQLGYAPATWEALLGYFRRQKSDLELARKGGMLRDGEQGLRDSFVDRLMFPIRDPQGRVIAFGGRGLRAEAVPKYLNSAESPIFSKGKVWFGLDRARKAIAASGRAIAVEGYMDVIGLHQAGVTNAIAALGTAITPQHVGAIRTHAKELVLAYDGDAAGIQAALNNAAMFEEAECAVRVAQLPPAEDPDTFVREQGAPAFLALIEAADPLLDYRLRLIRGRYNPNDPAERVAMVREAARAIAGSRSHLVRAEYAGKLQALINDLAPLGDPDQAKMEYAALLNEVRRIAQSGQAAQRRGQSPAAARTPGAVTGRPRGAATGGTPAPGALGQAAAGPSALTQAEEYVLRAALTDARWARQLAERLTPEQFRDEGCRRVAAALLGNNTDNSHGSTVAGVRDDPALAETVSRLLVVEDAAVNEREVEECLARLERESARQRVRQLQEEIVRGTLNKGDQRYEEFVRLSRLLHG